MTLQALLDRAAAPTVASIGTTHVAAALQAAVRRDGALLFDYATGAAQLEPTRALSTATPFDLASVSKVFTATAVMLAIDDGRCALDDDLGPWFAALRGVSLRQLMNHSAGIDAWDQFYLRMTRGASWAQTVEVRDEILAQILAKPRQPAGVHGVYSDLGYIVLGRLVEQLFDDALEVVVETKIATPLGLASLRYVSQRRGDPPIATAAATEHDPLRGGIVVGVVHDENCYIQGGVAGHAGLFGTARDVAAFGEHLVAVDRGGDGIVSTSTLHACWSPDARGGDGHFLAGWDTPSGARSTAGRGFAAGRTVGHLGFTGTSLWIERATGLVAVLLTNRVFPTRENATINDLRVAFHEMVFDRFARAS